MMCGARRLLAAGAATALLAFQAIADVRSLDRVELETALKKNSPCCVVDARSAKQRRDLPVADAVPYRAGMKLGGTGPVVVIADTDEQAVAIGARLTANGRTALAVRGGVSVWLAIVAPGAGAGMPKSFVIPSDTCKQGQPLQSLPVSKP